ncbi:MAG TPA: DUF308 domain-containing protein [Pseudolysinimonas sp.]|nr:DUF308 domain-containing protein [Pseudolysinimonas sp.]
MRRRSWILPGSRALLSIALGLLITFNSNHSPSLGLTAFGIFAILTGLVIVGFAAFTTITATARVPFIAQGVVTLAAGIAAATVPNGGVRYLVLVLSGWAIIAGVLELVSGVRSRGTAPGARDWTIVGALTVILGIIVLVVPPDFVLNFEGEKNVAGTLSSSIVIVGLLGFWAVITGVLQAIAAATPTAARPAGIPPTGTGSSTDASTPAGSAR